MAAAHMIRIRFVAFRFGFGARKGGGKGGPAKLGAMLPFACHWAGMTYIVGTEPLRAQHNVAARQFSLDALRCAADMLSKCLDKATLAQPQSSRLQLRSINYVPHA